jgi:hypothetical protein
MIQPMNRASVRLTDRSGVERGGPYRLPWLKTPHASICNLSAASGLSPRTNRSPLGRTRLIPRSRTGMARPGPIGTSVRPTLSRPGPPGSSGKKLIGCRCGRTFARRGHGLAPRTTRQVPLAGLLRCQSGNALASGPCPIVGEISGAQTLALRALERAGVRGGRRPAQFFSGMARRPAGYELERTVR